MTVSDEGAQRVQERGARVSDVALQGGSRCCHAASLTVRSESKEGERAD